MLTSKSGFGLGDGDELTNGMGHAEDSPFEELYDRSYLPPLQNRPWPSYSQSSALRASKGDH